MPTADCRPLLRISPENLRHLAAGLVLSVELHRRIKEGLQRARNWGGESGEIRRVQSAARQTLAGVKGLFLEPYDFDCVACILPDPEALGERIELASAAALALAAQTDWRLNSAGLVGWALIPATRAAGLGSYPDLSKFDASGAAERALLRRRAFGPWLNGQVPVRHPEAFRSFHLGLDPAEQQLVYAVNNCYGTFRLPDPASKPDTAWAYDRHADLVAAGWLSFEPTGPGAGSSVQLYPGTLSRRMAPGEMGPGY